MATIPGPQQAAGHSSEELHRNLKRLYRLGPNHPLGIMASRCSTSGSCHLVQPSSTLAFSYLSPSLPTGSAAMLLYNFLKSRYIRVSQNATFFHEPVHMMGEVIIKWFYFYYFRFRQLFERALLKNQNHFFFTWSAVNLRNAAENLFLKKSRIFGNFITQHFLWIYIIFHILIQTKNPWFFFIIFSGILIIHAPHLFLRMRTTQHL